jgi:aspartokinase-like uncharacterized kinase
MNLCRIIVKVGGSLFDLPDLGARLHLFLESLTCGQIVLVPGGGPACDLVRQWDRNGRLGDEAAHWLALRAMTWNGRYLQALLRQRQANLCGDPLRLEGIWSMGAIPILDAFEFALADEGRTGCLPHGWHVTSDCVAARLAAVTGSDCLILLKSVTMPDGTDCRDAMARGWIDPYFQEVVLPGAANEEKVMRILAVNFRAWTTGFSATTTIRVGALPPR